MTYPRSGCHPNQLFCGQSLQASCSMGGFACQQLGVGGGQIGVQTSLERKQSPPVTVPTGFSTSPGSLGILSPGARSTGIDFQRRGGSGSEQVFPGFLRETICSPQIVRRVETSVGPFSVEPFSSTMPVQNGNYQVSEGRHQTQRLGSIAGFERCLFPHSHSSVRPEVPKIHLARPSISVYSSPLWPRSGSMVVHQNNLGVMSSGQELRYSSQGLPRRLASSGYVGNPMPTADAVGFGEVSRSGFYSEFGEIRPHSESGVHLPGNEVQHFNLVSVSSPSADCSSGGYSLPPPVFASSASQDGSIAPGFHGVDGDVNTSWSSSQTECSEAVYGSSRLSGLVAAHSARSPLSISSVSVAEPILDVGGRSDYSPSPAGIPLHGCLSKGLGRPHGQSDCVRSLGSGNVSSSYQSFRAGGSFYGSTGVLSYSSGETHPPQYGQYNRGLLSEQAGRGTLLFPLAKGGAYTSMVSREGHSSDSNVHSGEVEHLSRCAEQVAHGFTYGVDVSPQGTRTSVEALVQTGHRSVCHSVQQTSSSICVSSSGSAGVGDRRPISPLDVSSGIRVSSPSNSGEGSQKGEGGTSDAYSGRSSLGKPTLVSRSSKSHTRRSSATRSRPRVSSSTSDRCTAQKPRDAQPSRMASVRESLSARGASTDVLNLVEQAHRPGTKKLYDSRWLSWSRWCSDQDVNPVKPSRFQFANYLAMLAKEKHLSASSVKGHRASISTTIKQLGGHGFSEDYLLKDVVKGVTLQEARTPRLFPAWDLNLVVGMLRSDPFEPINSCPLDKLTFKTVFLISLASGRRCSEVHALHYQSLAWESDGSVSLRFLPGFLAKNQPPDQPSPPIIIKALAPILCPDDIDRYLCPIRCLKSYLKRTKHLRSHSKKCLFVSPLESKKSDISVSSISRWIKNVIREAYCSPEVTGQPDNVRAHEVRAWATSLAWANNTSLKDLMEAAYWFGRPTFFQFYLRDVSHKKLDGSRGISLVAAQQILRR